MSIATHPADVITSEQAESRVASLATAAEVLLLALSTPAEALTRAYAKWGTVELRDFEIASGLIVTPPPESDLAALFLIWDCEDPAGTRWPHQALVVHSADVGWSVNWILAQCTSCFGVGIVGSGPGVEEICGTCGGGGWGLLSSVAYPYMPSTMPSTLVPN